MVKHWILSFCFIMILSAASALADDKPSDKLNGTWSNDIMTVTINVEQGTYSGVGLGVQFNNSINIVEEKPEYVVFDMTNEQGTFKVVAQFQADGSLMITKDGGMPMVLQPSQ